MLYISAENNALAPGIAELHMQPGEDITIIFVEGDEIYVNGDGSVEDGSGRRLTDA